MLAAILLGLALPAAGQPVSAPSTVAPETSALPSVSHGIGLRFGYNDDYRKYALTYEIPTLWSHRFQNDWGRLDLDAEFAVAYWRAQDGDPDSLWQLSATPMLRWWPSDIFYAEIGVGATVLNRTHFAGRNLSTAFQFGNHIGFGTVLNGAHRIGLRYSHFSNAGIKHPNPGLDVLTLTYTYRF
ncbi:acyloxyacyl hydrolase [Parapusillimonas sp. SGNA-6]|nr:acyloxyacyl hydrolase [Parapusillimonas sp. SGNA-6]